MALAWVVAWAPWLVLAPLGGTGGLVLHAAALACALHGWGRVATWREPRLAWPLVTWIGLATAVALAGIAAMFGLGGRAGAATITFVGLALHTIATMRLRPDDRREGGRWWLAAALIAVVVGALAVAGAAGDLAARPYDDDGHLLGQVRALADTGGLGDAVGFARAAQLGANVTLHALAAVVMDARATRALDALAFALVLALALARARPAGARGALWAAALTLVLFVLPISRDDAAPLWLIVGFVVALDTALAARVAPALIGLVAGAAVALRLELLPIAAAAVIAASASAGTRRERLIELARAIGAMLAVLAPYVIARALAYAALPDAARAAVGASRGGVLVHLAIALGVGVGAAPILALAIERRATAWGLAATLGVIAGGVISPASYGGRFAWALLAATIACATASAIARPDGGGRVRAFVLAVLACTALYAGQVATGRHRAVRRMLDLVSGIQLVEAGATSAAPDRYADVLATVPPGSTLVLDVPYPDAVDHARYRVFDLRVPRVKRDVLVRALAPCYLLADDGATVTVERR